MYGLLGKTLKHSFSPEIHAEFGSYPYTLFEIPENELDAFFEKSEFDGLNITVPYKKNVLKYLDAISDSARKIGAVNTIVKKDGKLIGYNTDYHGFKSLVRLSGVSIKNGKCLVFGTGGAAETAKAVLYDLGAESVVSVSRTGAVNYQNLKMHYDTDIIVNATPMGMYPNNLTAPTDISGFFRLSAVFDMIYNPLKTELVLKAEEMGAKSFGGLFMLTEQARKSAELFLDKKIDIQKGLDVYNELLLKKQNIVLVGMPGSGKTTIARVLAKKLSKDFVDTDLEIVKKTGKSIEEIFETGNELIFRNYESSVITAIGKKTNQIIATGGGAVTIQKNKAALRQNSVVVFIERALSELETNGRPLSKTVDLDFMYKKRLPLYEDFSDIKIEVMETPEKTAQKILDALKSMKRV